MGKGRKSTDGAGTANGVVILLTILSVALILVRRVLLANRLSDNGLAYFNTSLITCLFFSLFCIHATSASTSRILSVRCAKGQYRNASVAFTLSGLITGALALFCCLLYYLLSSFLANQVYHVPVMVTTLRYMTPLLLMSALYGLMRSYFHGYRTEIPNVLSRILKEALSLFIMFGLITSLGNQGAKIGALLINSDYEQAFQAAGAAFGYAIGTGIAFLFLLLLYFLSRNGFRNKGKKEQKKATESFSQILPQYTGYYLPELLTCLVLFGRLCLDQVMYLGFTNTAGSTIEEWGIYTGKALFLAILPCLLTNWLNTAVLAPLTPTNALRSMNRLREKTFLTVKLAILIALPICLFYLILSESLMSALFTVGDTQTAASLLKLLVPAILLTCLNQALSLTMCRTGYEKNFLIHGFVSLAVHALFLFLFLNVMTMGINGVIHATTISSAFSLILNLVFILRRIPPTPSLPRCILISLLGSTLVGLLWFMLDRFLSERLTEGTECLLLGVLGCLLYLVILLILHALTERELKSIPCGRAILSLGRVLRLI